MFLICSLMLSLQVMATAAGLVVTNANDSGPGSLRQTVATAAPGDYITFASGVSDITLASSISIDKNLTIYGHKQIYAAISSSTLFNITAGTVSLNNLNLNGSSINGYGNVGAITNHGNLTLTGCSVRDSYSSGIANFGTLTVRNGTISNNRATIGGGIYNSGNLTASNTQFTGNIGTTSGGGIYSFGTANLVSCTFSNNSQGIDTFEVIAGGDNAVLTVNFCTFNNNTQSGVLQGHGEATIRNSIFTANGDTGIDNTGGNLTLERSQVNSQGSLFGVKNAGTASVSQTTFRDEGSVRNDNAGSFINCTFSGNSNLVSAGNLAVESSTFKVGSGKIAIYAGYRNLPGTINNTIIDDAPTSGAVTNVTSGDYNLIRNAASYTFASGGTHNVTGVDPLLAPLQGSAIPFHTLMPGSPAIDAANPDSTFKVDQLDQKRPYDGDGDGVARNDIGAFEVESYTIRGRVTSEGGVAIPGVTVTRTLSGNNGAPEAATAVTNSLGYYTFLGNRSGSYILTPTLTNHTFEPSSKFTTSHTETRTHDFIGLDTTRTVFSIYGRVTSSSQAALGGVRLDLSNGDFAVTNSAGYYQINGVPNGSYTLTPSGSNLVFTPASRSITISNRDAVAQNFQSVEQTPGPFFISGRVTSGEYPAPNGGAGGDEVPNVPVKLSGGAFTEANSKTVLTQSNGSYIFSGLPAATYTIESGNPNFPFQPATRTVTITNSSISNLNFIGGLGIKGRVTTTNQTAAGGVRVEASNGAFAITNSAGYYHIPALPKGTYTVRPVSSDGMLKSLPATRTVTLSNSDVLDQDFFVYSQGFLVHGRIATSSGAAIANHAVTLSGGPFTGSNCRTVNTNSAGYYNFGDIPPGTYIVTPAAGHYRFAPQSRTVTVGNSNVANQNFVGMSGFLLHGRVSDSRGHAIPNVRVTRSGSNASVLTNSAGYYAFQDVPNGSYTVTPALSGFYFTPASRQITINGADVVNQNFVGQNALYIHGRIAASNGTGLVGVQVTLSGGQSTPVLTNSAGYYVFRDLVPGTYTITPSSSSYSFTPSSRTVTVTTDNAINQNFVGQ